MPIDGDDSFVNAVELLAARIREIDELAPEPGSMLKLKRQLLQLVRNYRARALAAAIFSSASPPSFRVFRRVDATLPGGELGAAVWFCSPATPDTFGIVVAADAAAQYPEGAQFVLIPEKTATLTEEAGKDPGVRCTNYLCDGRRCSGWLVPSSMGGAVCVQCGQFYARE